MPDAPTTFFLDNTFAGNKIPRALRRAHLQVVRLKDHFGRDDVPDEEWIPLVSEPPFEWVIVTKDNRILANPNEFEAICQARARIVLFPVDEDLTAEQIVERFLFHLPAIRDVIAERQAPFIIYLHAGGVQVLP